MTAYMQCFLYMCMLPGFFLFFIVFLFLCCVCSFYSMDLCGLIQIKKEKERKK